MKSRICNKRGQAVAEMALFGSLVLIGLATLLSYVQRYNDQQYVQMEVFRRALEKACTYQGAESEGAGGSVRFNLIQNRRHADISNNFQKRSAQTISGFASVFWAVPKSGQTAETLNVYRINEDEKQLHFRDFVPKDMEDEWLFQPDKLVTEYDTNFSEDNLRQETPEGIINTRTSELDDTITTTVPYRITQTDTDSTIEEGTLWEVEQGLYQDAADGQYKYSSQAVGTEVRRGKRWSTRF